MMRTHAIYNQADILRMHDTKTREEISLSLANNTDFIAENIPAEIPQLCHDLGCVNDKYYNRPWFGFNCCYCEILTKMPW